MSFSNQVREELAREVPERFCCRKAELAALLSVSSQITRQNPQQYHLIVQAEQAATAKKIFTLFKSVYGLPTTVKVVARKRFKKTRLYEAHALIGAEESHLWQELQLRESGGVKSRHHYAALIGKSCCKRAFLRGIFLARGSINRPEGEYHLEITLPDQYLAADIQKILSRFYLPSRVVERKKNLVLYIKEGEKIVDFLRVVGAHKALLDFENVRIVKSMRNSVNRQVNCETANLAKTVEASVRQIDLIKKLVERKGWDVFPHQLRDLARVRVEFPDYSLKELGAMLNPPLSKSGAAYRMRKLEQWAEDMAQEG